MKSFKKYYFQFTLILSALATFGIATAQDYDFESNEFGQVVMEAENYSYKVAAGGAIGSGSESLWDSTASPADYSGDSAMQAVNPGPAPGGGALADVPTENVGYMAYNINFSIPGTYYIWARASHMSGSDDSYNIILTQGDNVIDQHTFLYFDGSIPEENVGVWSWIHNYNDGSNPASATVVVPIPGVFTYKVYIREREFKIDKIVLTIDQTYVPEGLGPDETKKPTGLKSFTNDDAGLVRVYPNPARTGTTISYRLDKPEYVNIKIYNVLGEEVTTLTDELQSEGLHEVRWNATDMSDKLVKKGIYFIKVKAGSDISTAKMMLTR